MSVWLSLNVYVCVCVCVCIVCVCVLCMCVSTIAVRNPIRHRNFCARTEWSSLGEQLPPARILRCSLRDGSTRLEAQTNLVKDRDPSDDARRLLE